LLHDIPVLWEFHKVHHSAEVLTPLTAYRVHPVELALMAWVPALATGIVTWAFNRFADGAVSFYSFLGLHVAIWAFNLIDNLRHSPVWISYGPVWGRWLVSPAHHQLHHSREPQHWGRNRGSNLAIWDRLYGTLYVPPVRAETFQMGLGDGTDGHWNSVARMYFWPLAGAMRRISDLVRGRSAPRAS
jgi:sterol desaturase/sphingolipid hydroxylase (fatty acid hydroxylase superfamily)